MSVILFKELFNRVRKSKGKKNIVMSSTLSKMIVTRVNRGTPRTLIRIYFIS